MPRYKLLIEYNGAPFVGWQVQHNGVSVQGVLTAAVAAFNTGARRDCPGCVLDRAIRSRISTG